MSESEIKVMLFKKYVDSKLNVELLLSILLLVGTLVFFSEQLLILRLLTALYSAQLMVFYGIVHKIKKPKTDELTKANIGNLSSAIQRMRDVYENQIVKIKDSMNTMETRNAKLKQDLDNVVKVIKLTQSDK